MEIDEWRKQFDEVSRTKPDAGYSIVARDGQRIKMSMEFNAGSDPLIYTRVYVPQTVGQEPKWYAQGENEGYLNFGLRLILRPRSRDKAIKKVGLMVNEFFVKELEVIKISQSGDSILGEIKEW